MNIHSINIALNKARQLFLIVPDFLRGFTDFSYSQDAEDLVISELISLIDRGFYVDVGAYDPKRFSNTYRLYLKGWSGINIEPRPGSKEKFDRQRPRDINIETGISTASKALTYYQFNEPALNGFSKNISKSRDGYKNYKIIRTTKVQTHPLRKILDENIGRNKKNDLMTIDVEGLEGDVLETNDWKIYKPKFVIIEDAITERSRISESSVNKYLVKRNYKLFACTLRSVFYRLQ